jgi:adenylylsulfate kinase
MTWRVVATCTTIVLVYAFTGQIVTALEVGSLEAIAKLIFYYLHERGWSYVRWGKVLPKAE